jgi:hypothetical protein
MSEPPQKPKFVFRNASTVQIIEHIKNYFGGSNTAQIIIEHVENFIVGNDTAQAQQQRQRYRRSLLSKVRGDWINDFLSSSLYLPLIRLRLSESRFSVHHSASGFEIFDQSVLQPLSEGTEPIDVFRAMGDGRSLLILGAPGAGKTIALLKIAETLITEADNDPAKLIPVIFNLASWTSDRSDINQWLLKELRSSYKVANETGELWLKQQQLILLLDGLDEVHERHLNECIHNLNQFIQDHGETEIVICCRTEDYANFEKLQLRKAIYVHPLSKEQVAEHLAGEANHLHALQALVQEDPKLLELFQAPLMLSIASQAYEGISTIELPQSNSEDIYAHIFQAYVNRMLYRRQKSQRYPKDKTLPWLTWLASRLTKASQSIFLIERLQPSWLKMLDKLTYSVLVGLFYGLIYGLAAGLPATLTYGWIVGLALFFLMGIGFGLASWILTVLSGDRIVEILVEYCLNLISQLLGRGKGVRNISEIPVTTIPNQEVKETIRSARNWAIVGAIGGGLFSLIFERQFFWIGIFFGAISIAVTVGRSAILHLSLRLVLYRAGKVPWHYADFLNYAHELGLLRKVGGGYTFVHRSLQKHFAKMDGI